MPEGDTVHKLATYLDRHLRGRRLDAVRLRSGPRRGWGGTTPEAVAGTRVAAVLAQGKHLFIELEGDLALRTHLGLYGSWHQYAAGEVWRKPERQASLVLESGGQVFVCFNAREVEVLRSRGIRRRDLSAGLGPDLVAEEPDPGAVAARARTRHGPDALLVDVLLDQRVAAGIGNVYKSELLFLHGLHPETRLRQVATPALTAVFATAADLLRRNLGPGPRTTRFAADGLGRLWVYRRGGQNCLRCDTPIRSAKLGQTLRSTYWCPRCQAVR